ncbi:MAG: PTS glucitol/sorbitol transporter subunit IIA [Candidatus Dormibacteria bacterium]
MTAASRAKLRTRVVAVGPLVEEFRASGLLVLFQKDAPEELAEFSILHDASLNLATVAPGDTLRLGAETYGVLAVGSVVNKNLASLGHLSLKANGLSEPEMLGDVCLEAKPLPSLQVGDEIEILGPP